MTVEANICQVAIVSKQAKLLRDWYCQIFGFLPSSRTVFAGALASRVQGVPKDLNICYWAIDGKRQFQLEFFNFISPNVTPKPKTWQPYDHGYNVIGIHTWNFEETLSKLKSSGATMLSDIRGNEGERWLMLCDPDGNHLEITEVDPLTEQTKEFPEICASVRYVRMSVPDIAQAQQLWQEAFSLTRRDDIELPNYHDQVLLTADNPQYQHCLLQGQGILLELRQYSSPVPMPRLVSHNVTDQGIMNIAIGADSVEQWDSYYDKALALDCRANGKPLDAAIFKVMYVNEPNKENIEILYPRKWAYGITGFTPSGVFARGEINIHASIEDIWQAITNHDNAGDWAFFSSKLIKSGDRDENGLNAVRKIGLFGLSFEETVTSWKTNQSYHYQLDSQWLIRHHRGVFKLNTQGEQTKLIWAIHFSATLPGLGKITSVIMTAMINKSLRKLKAIIEKQTS